MNPLGLCSDALWRPLSASAAGCSAETVTVTDPESDDSEPAHAAGLLHGFGIGAMFGNYQQHEFAFLRQMSTTFV